MRRKGWTPNEDDMTAVVAIHNAVNERAWREILHWEKAHSDESAAYGGPQLVRFQGRPNDYSPKARLLNALGYALPFDRHDWVVERGPDRVRYVIDFYNAAPSPDMPVAVHLDVRPALDSPSAFVDRLRMQWKWFQSKRWISEA
ncbi:cytochrome c/c1 heme lyase [Helicosporidium sp. ATCC 50920]|nr:cytochrome c/c1 heme lyase [Helicosporidium sp. ATCC 50920]|eukprot:KDD72196.1 cytochrome c/c1 heme lyase [Helicosporidium sp. ATCC 50920]